MLAFSSKSAELSNDALVEVGKDAVELHVSQRKRMLDYSVVALWDEMKGELNWGKKLGYKESQSVYLCIL